MESPWTRWWWAVLLCLWLLLVSMLLDISTVTQTHILLCQSYHHLGRELHFWLPLPSDLLFLSPHPIALLASLLINSWTSAFWQIMEYRLALVWWLRHNNCICCLDISMRLGTVIWQSLSMFIFYIFGCVLKVDQKARIFTPEPVGTISSSILVITAVNLCQC